MLATTSPWGSDLSVFLGCAGEPADIIVHVSATGASVGTTTASDARSYVELIDFETGDTLQSEAVAPSAYRLEVVSYVESADGTVDWSGRFSWSGETSAHTAEVVGDFSVQAVAQ